MKNTLLIIFSLLCFNLYSQNWEYNCKDKFGNKYYIKNNIVSNKNGIVRIWTRATITEIHFETKKKTYYDCYRILLYEFDCTNDKARVLSATYYSSDGSILGEETADENFASWNYITPDSIEEKMKETVCNLYN